MSIILPKTNLYLEGCGHDVNGNRIVKIGMSSLKRGFSIQTVQPWGYMVKTHKALQGLKTKKDLRGISDSELVDIAKEVSEFIKEYGTDLQKKSLRVYE